MLILDGAYGTEIQKGFTARQLRSLYKDAGADLLSMNFFELSVARSSETLRRLVQEATSCDEGYRYYCNLGPTDVLLSLTPGKYEAVYDLYYHAAIIACEKTNIFLLETQTDLRNIKCAIDAVTSAVKNPVIWVSVSPDSSGHLMSGQSLRITHDALALYSQVEAFGVNCVSPSDGFRFVSELSHYSTKQIIYKPNAGLPSNGVYTGFDFEEDSYCFDGIVNIVGGCCGTTPESIKQFHCYNYLSVYCPQPFKPHFRIAERFNANGSKKFRKACLSNDFTTVSDLLIGSYNAVDINLDHWELADSKRAIYLQLIQLPSLLDTWISIDTTDWDFMIWALSVTPQPCIVNSIAPIDDDWISRLRYVSTHGGFPIVRGEHPSLTGWSLYDYVKPLVSKVLPYYLYDPCFKPLGLDNHVEYFKELTLFSELSNLCPGLSNISFAYKQNKNFRRHFNIAIADALNLTSSICNPADYLDYSSDLVAEIKAILSDPVALQSLCDFTNPDVPDYTVSHPVPNLLLLGDTKALSSVPFDDLISAFMFLGEQYDANVIGVTHVLKAAATLKQLFPPVSGTPQFALGTIEGDLHDIGKDITIGVVEASQIPVADLGVDMPYSALKQAACNFRAVGISALITPSLFKIQEHLLQLDKDLPSATIFLGGAVVDQAFTDQLQSKLSRIRVVYTKTPTDTLNFLKTCL